MQNQSPNSGGLPLIGNLLSLITYAEMRYEGTLSEIDTENATVSLQDVKCFGTEGRKTPNIPESSQIYGCIMFSGRDVKDVQICENRSKIMKDPAIISIQPNQNSPQDQSHDNQPKENYPMFSGGQPSYDYSYNFNRGNERFKERFHEREYPTYGGHDRYDNRPGGYGRHERDNRRNNANSQGGSRNPVGELQPAVNEQLKKELEREFDVEESNQKFCKVDVEVEKKEEGEATEGAKLGVNVGQGPDQLHVRTGYNKTSSFFDNISCEALDREIGHDNRIDRDKRRHLDVMTFGQEYVEIARRGLQSNTYRRGRGRDRYAGRGGGGSGYRGGSGYNRGGYRGGRYMSERQDMRGGDDRYRGNYYQKTYDNKNYDYNRQYDQRGYGNDYNNNYYPREYQNNYGGNYGYHNTYRNQQR
eukprot:Platyproteum_vivax@DN5918_c0_g1_i2.p1